MSSILPEPLVHKIKSFAPEHAVRFKCVVDHPVFVKICSHRDNEDPVGFGFFRGFILRWEKLKRRVRKPYMAMVDKVSGIDKQHYKDFADFYVGRNLEVFCKLLDDRMNEQEFVRLLNESHPSVE